MARKRSRSRKSRRPKYAPRKSKSLKGMTAAQKHAHRRKVRRDWYHKRLKPLRRQLRLAVSRLKKKRLALGGI